jgi:hypothetical protein
VIRRTAFDAGLFVCAGLSIASLLVLEFPFIELDCRNPEGIVAAATSLGFVCAAALVVLRPRKGRVLGLIVGIVALGLFARMDRAREWSSWVFLNMSDAAYFRGSTPAAAKVRIVAPMLTVVAVGVCLFRRRRWLAFASAAAIVVGAWFGYSVTPYRVIGFNHGIRAEIRILRTETRAGLPRNGRCGIPSRNGLGIPA